MAYKTLTIIAGLAFTAWVSTSATLPNRDIYTNTDKAGLLDTSRVYDLDEVVIVSQPKEITTLRRQPLSSTVLSGHDLSSLGANSLSDIAAYVPSSQCRLTAHGLRRRYMSGA